SDAEYGAAEGQGSQAKERPLERLGAEQRRGQRSWQREDVGAVAPVALAQASGQAEQGDAGKEQAIGVGGEERDEAGLPDPGHQLAPRVAALALDRLVVAGAEPGVRRVGDDPKAVPAGHSGTLAERGDAGG